MEKETNLLKELLNKIENKELENEEGLDLKGMHLYLRAARSRSELCVLRAKRVLTQVKSTNRTYEDVIRGFEIVEDRTSDLLKQLGEAPLNSNHNSTKL